MLLIQRNTCIMEYFLYDVLAMVKQLGILTYFLTLPFAEVRWEELPYIVNKLNSLGLLLVVRHFQYKVEVFSKEIILDSPLGKTKYVIHNWKKLNMPFFNTKSKTVNLLKPYLFWNHYLFYSHTYWISGKG